MRRYGATVPVVDIDESRPVDRLLAAAAHEMARNGWQTVPIERIEARAGVADDRGVAYHFGSREGMVFELVSRAVRALEPARRVALDELAADAGVADLLDAMVPHYLDRLLRPGARDLLWLGAQLGDYYGSSGVSRESLMAGTAVVESHQRLVALVAEQVGTETAIRCVQTAEVFLSAVASERAAGIYRWVDRTGVEDPEAAARELGLPDHETFVADTLRQLAAALQA